MAEDKISVIFHLNVKIFAALGLPGFLKVFSQRKNKLAVLIYNSYVVIIDICFIFLGLRVLAKLLFVPISTELIIEGIIAFAFLFQNFLRVVILYEKRKAIENYLGEINETTYISLEKGQDKFVKMFEENHKVAREVGKGIIIFLFVFSFLTFVLGPFVLPPEKDLVPGLYPLRDVHYSLIYIYHVIDFVAAGYALPRSTAMDLLCLTFVIFQLTQQQYLKEELRNILQKMKHESGLVENGGKQLEEWFRFHQDSLRSLEHLKEFLKPLLLITYVYGLTNIVNLIFFTIAEGEMGFAQKTMGIISMSASFAFVGWLCVLTDQLNNVQEDLLYLFDLDFIAQNRWLKNHYLIFGPMCYKRRVISAMGLFQFSARGFTEMMSTSFSMLATFWQIKNRASR